MTASAPRGDAPRPRLGDEVVLAAQPASVSLARRLARELLEPVAPAIVDDAAVIVTELVANAVLHASGPVRLEIGPAPEGPAIRIAVADSSPAPPAVREYGTGAATGRGLTLVSRISRAWGVDPAPEGEGKVVWAELVPSGGEVHAVRDPSSTMPTPPSPPVGDARTVVFAAVPVPVYLRLQEQNDAVLRELELVAFTADHEGDVDPSPELVDLIERSRAHFNRTREGFRGEVSAAAERGETTIDLVGSLPISSIEPSAELVGLFEQAEDLARAGELLIGPPDDDVARLRHWFVNELTGQLLDGRPPRPFSS